MEPFSIKLTIPQEKSKLFLFQRIFTFLTIAVGIYLLVSGILQLRRDPFANTAVMLVEMVVGGAFTFVPILLLFLAPAQSVRNVPRQQEIEYTFSEESVEMKGGSFNVSLQWSFFLRLRDTKNFLLLYQTSRHAYFIKKAALTAEQIAFIKSKIKYR